MKKLSVTDEVVISLAIRSELRFYLESYKLRLEQGLDTTFCVDNIKQLVHAYNSVNAFPFLTEDTLLLNIINQ